MIATWQIYAYTFPSLVFKFLLLKQLHKQKCGTLWIASGSEMIPLSVKSGFFLEN